MNNFFKKLIALTLIAVMSLCLFACDISDSDLGSSAGIGDSSSGGTHDGDVALTLVSINDIHGSIEQNENGTNGLSNTARIIDKMSANYGKADKDVRDDVALFGNGDMFQGTAISNMSRGRAVIEAMNDMRFDAMSLGNHEFDWGIETITAYFDGDATNGEANFPLVTANVYQKSGQTYLSDLSEDDNIVNGTIVEKSGVKIGYIGVIGPIENSIIVSKVQDYSFRQEYVVDRVKNVAIDLKNDGADIITVSIHYGENYNDELAALQNNGDYLIDVIFNGHTHSTYSQVAVRPDKSSVPVVQGGSNNRAFSYVKLTYSTDNGQITYNNYDYRTINSSDREYDETVETTIREYRSTLIDSLPALATSAVTVNYKNQLCDYIGNVAIAALQTDYFTSNYAGLRATGDITVGKPVKEDAFYKIIPFDNTMYVVKMRGEGLYKFYTKQGQYYYFAKNTNAKSIESLENDKNYYTLAIIDYVYTGVYFSNFMEYVDTSTEVNSQLYLRDLLVEDAKLCGLSGKKWSYNNTPFIGRMDY